MPQHPAEIVGPMISEPEDEELALTTLKDLDALLINAEDKQEVVKLFLDNYVTKPVVTALENFMNNVEIADAGLHILDFLKDDGIEVLRDACAVGPVCEALQTYYYRGETSEEGITGNISITIASCSVLAELASVDENMADAILSLGTHLPILVGLLKADCSPVVEFALSALGALAKDSKAVQEKCAELDAAPLACEAIKAMVADRHRVPLMLVQYPFSALVRERTDYVRTLVEVLQRLSEGRSAESPDAEDNAHAAIFSEALYRNILQPGQDALDGLELGLFEVLKGAIAAFSDKADVACVCVCTLGLLAADGLVEDAVDAFIPAAVSALETFAFTEPTECAQLFVPLNRLMTKGDEPSDEHHVELIAAGIVPALVAAKESKYMDPEECIAMLKQLGYTADGEKEE